MTTKLDEIKKLAKGSLNTVDYYKHDFEAYFENSKEEKYYKPIKVPFEEIPNYEIFCVLSQCICNDDRDDTSIVRFISTLTVYDEMKRTIESPYTDALTKKQVQINLDYVDGKTDEQPAFWVYKERTAPQHDYETFNIKWETWCRKEAPDLNDLFEYIRKNIDSTIWAAKHKGADLYGEASKVKYYRLKNGMTQEKLASLIGVQRSRIAKIENGTIDLENCTAKTVRALSEQLGVSMEELLDTRLYTKKEREKKEIDTRGKE